MPSVPALGSYSSECLEFFDLLEIDNLTIERIRTAEDSVFTPLGNISIMGEPIAAGIKKRHPRETKSRVARELYLADQLLAAFPERSSALPLFTYAVRDEEKGKYAGILTEDFTRNGTRVLDEIRIHFSLASRLHGRRQDAPEGLHRDVYDALNGDVYPEAFRHMTGRLLDHEVLVDFDNVAESWPDDVHVAYEEIVDQMTVVIP